MPKFSKSVDSNNPSFLQPFILKVFNLKPEEMPKFLLLFFHSFFLGLLVSFHFVPSNAIFIKNFGHESLPIAYFSAGVMGFLSTQLFSTLQRRITSDNLFRGLLLFLLIFTLLQTVARYFVNEKELSFFIFIWDMPFLTLIGLGTNGLALRLLDLRQMKRLLGFINIGGVLAATLGYILIPILIRFIGHPYNLMYIAAFGISVSFVLLIIILRRFPEKVQVVSDKHKPQTTFKDIIKQRYFFLIAISGITATLVIYFTDFIYLSSIRAQREHNLLFNSAEQVAKFISLAAACFKGGELIVSFFSNRLLSRFGMALGLTMLPYIATTFIFFAAVAGLISGPLSIIFFSLVVLNKVIDRTLRMSIDVISNNILYQPLEGRQKFEVQAKVGVLQQFSVGLAGLLLFVISKLVIAGNDLNLKYFTLLFLPVLFLWAFSTSKLFLEYKKRIRQLLADASKHLKRDIYKHIYGSEILTKKLKKFNSEAVNLSVTILSETNPILLEPLSSALLETDNLIITKAVLRNIDSTWRPKLLQNVQKLVTSENEEIKELAQRAAKYLDFANIKTLPREEIDNLLASPSHDDKIYATKALLKLKSCDDESIILSLLNDTDERIIRAAIRLAGRSSSQLVISKLVGMIQSPQYYHIIANTLLDIGDKILSDLETVFNQTKSKTVLLRITEIYAKIGSTASQNLLLLHINYPDKEIQDSVIRALHFCRFEATEEQVVVINGKIHEVVECIVWLYACILDIENHKNTLKVYLSLDLELQNNIELLFKLLSFVFPAKIINLIKKNIQGENTIFALEIIDNFISLEIKQLIMPLFDSIPMNQKVKKLAKLFPYEKMSLADRLKNIITRDYTRVDLWTVSKAIELLGKLHRKRTETMSSAVHNEFEDIDFWTTKNVKEILRMIQKSEIPDEIFACLYHPDELIFTTAAKLIHDENPSRCTDYLRKLSSPKQNLIAILEDESKRKQLITERVRQIKRHPLFFSVPQNILVKVAKLITVNQLSKGERISLLSGDNYENIFIVISGILIYKKGKKNELQFVGNDIVMRGLNIEEKSEYLIAEKNSIVLSANRFEYFNLLVDENDLIQHIFEGIQSKKGDEEEE